MAIAWNIVKHRQGEIQVGKSTLGGLRVSILLSFQVSEYLG